MIVFQKYKVFMNPRDYEQLLSQIVEEIYKQAEDIKPDVRYSDKNLWQGQSGYQHQIDMSIQGPHDAILVECKYWTKRISVEAVLTFWGRIFDITPTLKGKMVHAVLVTTIGFQAGAKIFANYYNIDLKLVKSAHEFAIAYKGHLMMGVHDTAMMNEKIRIERTCQFCGTNLIPNTNEQTFSCPKCQL